MLVSQLGRSLAEFFGLEAQFRFGLDLRSGLLYNFPPVLIILMRVLLIIDPQLVDFLEDYFLNEVVLDALPHVHLQRPVVLIDQVAVVQVILL